METIIDHASLYKHFANLFVALSNREEAVIQFMLNGYDIDVAKKIIRKVMTNSVRALQTATHFKKASVVCSNNPRVQKEGQFIPCLSTDFGAQEMSWTNIAPDLLSESPIILNHFLRAWKEVIPEDCSSYSVHVNAEGLPIG